MIWHLDKFDPGEWLLACSLRTPFIQRIPTIQRIEIPEIVPKKEVFQKTELTNGTRNSFTSD
jgi:hypothetical protein